MRDKLFEYIASRRKWHVLALLKKVWNAEADAVFDRYRSKLAQHLNRYMESEAGQAFKEVVERSRKTHGTIPEFQIGFLRNYAGKDGIEWGTKQVLDIFSELRNITDVVEYPDVYP